MRVSDGPGVKLGARDATDGLGSWSDASSRHRDAPDIRIGTDMTADATRSIGTH